MNTKPVLVIVRALLMEEAMSEWRKIETAPKDGTPVIVLVDGVAIEGRHREYGWSYAALNSHGCGCCADGDPDPTHWMPLPAPPK